jgi:hypothetical protein
MTNPDTNSVYKPPEVSPTGQMVGLSRWFNELPVGVQNAIVGLVALAGVVQLLGVTSPGLLPQNVVGIAGAVSGLGVALGIVSGGVRK